MLLNRKSLNLLPAVAALIAFAVLVSGQSSADFVNIDCGKSKDYTYNDTNLGLIYTSDFQYIDTGEIHKIDPSFVLSYYTQAYDLRSFPDGRRNCYTIKPVEKGGRYLVKASFLYGNYDGENKLPEFDLYLGVNFWQSVFLRNASIYYFSEIVAVATSDQMPICLINTGSGTPFISALELRLLPSDFYQQANSSRAFNNVARINCGGNKWTRYPSDPYDRFWSTYNLLKWTNLSIASPVSITEGYQPPSDVMQTASYPTSGSTMSLSTSLRPEILHENPSIHVFLHFAELQELKANETRIFNVKLNGETFGNPVRPSYLKATTVYAIKPRDKANLEIVLQKTGESTLSPILNAAELYMVRDMKAPQTDSDDVDAVKAIKASYKVQKDWVGDPCSPTNFTWHGLNCSFDGFTDLRIISLNLSSSGLYGEISISFANLSQLQYLDLSRNKLTGGVPDILANLTHLKFLDVSGNKLNGYIPKALLDRAAVGNLTLRNSCNGSDDCGRKKNNRVAIAVTVTIASVMLLVVAVLLVIFKLKKRTCPGNLQSGTITGAQTKTRSSSFQMPSFRLENRQFTIDDLAKITNNFSTEIGRGGFGPVYYGVLGNKDEVAVKMLSKSSSQGPREFQTEAHLLTRIHHKNLVSLVGYCNDTSSLALMYEYMAEGSLHDHLTGKARNALSWVERLRISVEAAQGLDYLHVGCRPAIIHRDVKTNNILLNKNLEAKISDFGLSRFFQNNDFSYISTKVVGTPGYLDPEYYQTNKLNEKSDVYSFGVVLLELITGHPAILKGVGNISLAQWVQERFERGQINEIIDRRIYGNCDINSVWKAVETAMACVSQASVQRPTMSDVLILLRDCLEIEAINARNNSSNPMNRTISSSSIVEITPLNMSMMFKPSPR